MDIKNMDNEQLLDNFGNQAVTYANLPGGAPILPQIRTGFYEMKLEILSRMRALKAADELAEVLENLAYSARSSEKANMRLREDYVYNTAEAALNSYKEKVQE